MDQQFHEPPELPRRFLEFICPDHLYESIAGDLQERFEEDLETMGLKAARRRYLWNTIRFFHPDILLRNSFKTPGMNMALLKSHSKLTIRNLLKGKLYSVINIAGLSLGIAACALILCFVYFHRDFDHMHPDLDRLYRVNQTAIWDKDGGIMDSSPPPLARVLSEDIPEITEATRIHSPGSALIRVTSPTGQEHAFEESGILAADSNFFNFFHLPLLHGHPEKALEGIGKVVITEEIAKKYFGRTDVVDAMLSLGDNRIPLQITGVTVSLPANMHLDFDLLVSMPTYTGPKEFDWSWIWTQMVTYCKIRPETDLRAVMNQLATIPDRYIMATFARLGMDFEDFVGDKGGWQFYLQPVRDIHLGSSEISNRFAITLDGAIVTILEVLAYLILIVAMINFVNLSTARSGVRHKEIGVKKTMGATSSSLMRQFLFESILIAGLATMIAFPLIIALSNIVLYFTNIPIPLDALFSIQSLIILMGAALVIGFLAGIYPALVLSRFKIARVLQSNSGKNISGLFFRNGLVVFQFAVSIALIAGTILIVRQLHFMKNKDLGFNANHILVVNNAEKLGNQLESFRNDLAGFAVVEKAAVSMEVPGRGSWEDIFMREGSTIKLPIGQIKIDDHFFGTLEFELVEGRVFDRARPADDHAVIINETTARLFGWANQEAIGKKIIYPGYPEEIRIIGVVNDFHYQSLRQDINPLMFFNLRSAMWGDMRVVTVKYGSGAPDVLLAQLENTWKKYAKDAPFDYSFYDEELAMLYEEETKMGHLIGIFGGFTLFISIIGLIGMVTYSVERRKKEIGIRKVMGATVFEIFWMFHKQYLVLGIIALFIAIPVAWNSLEQWLQNFAYRVSLDPSVFILSGLVVLILAGLSVSYLAVSAASVQPSTVLKDD